MPSSGSTSMGTKTRAWGGGGAAPTPPNSPPPPTPPPTPFLDKEPIPLYYFLRKASFRCHAAACAWVWDYPRTISAALVLSQISFIWLVVYKRKTSQEYHINHILIRSRLSKPDDFLSSIFHSQWPCQGQHNP